MKKQTQVRRNGSPRAAAPQSKTRGADGASSQPSEDLLNLVRSHATWNITSNEKEGLHRTLDGQLILVDRKPADLSGYVRYTKARHVSYAEACKWVRSSGNHWKPEVLLQFHGIMPAGAGPQVKIRSVEASPSQVGRKDSSAPMGEIEFHAWLKLENAVYETRACLYVLQQWIGNELREQKGNAASLEAGVYHLSESVSDRLESAFNRIGIAKGLDAECLRQRQERSAQRKAA